MFIEKSSTFKATFVKNHFIRLVAIATLRVNFRKEYSKTIFSEAVWGMKLKFSIHAYDISLYKVCVFYCLCPTTLIAMVT